MLVLALNRSAHARFCVVEVPVPGVGELGAGELVDAERVDVGDEHQADGELDLALERRLWLNCLTKLIRSPPACIEPMTSGLSARRPW